MSGEETVRLVILSPLLTSSTVILGSFRSFVTHVSFTCRSGRRRLEGDDEPVEAWEG